MTNELLTAKAVSVQYDEHRLLDAIDVSLIEGQITTVIGPNGAGKTTLVEVLLGLREPSEGRVWRAEHCRIGYVPQRFPVFTDLPLSVGRFLSLNLSRITQQQQQETLRLTAVDGLLEQSLSSVSGGELQRVLLARALIQQPNLLVLDEPAQGVDVPGQAEFYRLLSQIRDERGCAILLVSHDLHFVMAAADDVLCLNRHVCCHGHPESVSKHPEYQKLFGNLPLEGLAVYQHQHDHVHDLHGDEVPLEESKHG